MYRQFILPQTSAASKAISDVLPKASNSFHHSSLDDDTDSVEELKRDNARRESSSEDDTPDTSNTDTEQKKKQKKGPSIKEKNKQHKGEKNQNARTKKLKEIKAANFIELEDVSLTKVYVHQTLDSIIGTDQKGSIFWEKLFKTYCLKWNE